MSDEARMAAERYALSIVPEPTTANIGVRALAAEAFLAGYLAAAPVPVVPEPGKEERHG